MEPGAGTADLSAAAEKSKDGVRILFEAIDDAVFVHDAEGNILEANSAACRRLGYAREELLRLNTRDIDAPEFAQGFAERLRLQEKEGHFRCEGKHRTKDGRLISVDINSSIIKLHDKKAVLSVMRDITEQQQAQSRLGAQHAVARVLAEGRTLEESAPAILKVLCECLGSSVAALWVVQAKEHVLRCLEAWSHPAVQVPEFLAMTRRIAFGPGMGLPGRVWITRKVVTTESMTAAHSLPRITVARREGLHSGIAFPIQTGGETIGVLEFFFREVGRPDPDLLSMMAALGSQIGQVLERQRVEKALRDGEALYHSLVEFLPLNMFRKDRQGKFIFANRNFCNTLNRSLGELLGKTDFDFFPRELAAKYVRDDLQVMEKSTNFETVEEHVLPDGQKIYVQVIKTAVRDAQGNIIGTQGIFWDVTAKIRAEENLADSERRYRRLTEATQDAIIVADQEGLVTLFNPAAERLFGYQANEVIGQPITVLMPDEYRPLHERGLKRYLETRQARLIGRVVEVQGRRKTGQEFPMEIALSVLSMGGSNDALGRPAIQFLGAIRDLTERHQMRSVLIQNEKLAAIGLLSAGVAHEINNPLAFVANNLAVLEREGRGLLTLIEHYHGNREKLAAGDPDLVHKATELAEEIDLPYLQENLPRLLQRTREGVDRVSRIVHSLRGLARTDTPRRQETSIPALIDANLELLRGRLRKSGTTLEQQHDPLPRVSCVTTQMSQVLLNLMVNAAQAIEATKRTDGLIRVRTERQDHELLIEIADNGCGIDPEHLPKLFDPFFTTKEVGEGTGLGLSICHNIITAHGGRIEVESLPGQGATFRVYLPLHHPREST